MPRPMGGEQEWLMPITNVEHPGVGFPNLFMSGARRQEFMTHCLPSKYLFPNLQYAKASTRTFLRNGARFYFDTACQLEYAAAEGNGPLEALTNERAGDIITNEAVEAANRFWEEDGFRFRAYKDNVDSGTDSVGFHENYLILKDSEFGEKAYDEFISPLCWHLVSRIFYAGNGHLRADFKTNRLAYSLSSRASVTDHPISGSTTVSRALINTREEALADAKRFRRLHIICGDSLIAEPAIYLRYATTDLVLEMIETGFLKPAACADRSVFIKALKEFSADTTLTATAEFGGRRATAVDIQEEFRALSGRYVEKRGGITKVERLTFALWDEVIAAAKTSKPHEALAPYVDCAAKQLLLEQDMSRHGYDWKSDIKTKLTGDDMAGLNKTEWPVYNRAFYLSRKFSDNGPAGTGRKLIAAGQIKKILKGDEAERATRLPAPTCRSYARAMQLRWLQMAAESLGETFELEADWFMVTAKLKNGFLYHRFNSPDPRDPDPGLPLD